MNIKETERTFNREEAVIEGANKNRSATESAECFGKWWAHLQDELGIGLFIRNYLIEKIEEFPIGVCEIN